MPPRWSDYDIRDWIRLKPILHAQKTLRYRAIDKRYSRLPQGAGDLAAIGSRLRSRRVLVSIAFEDAEVIDWQQQLIRRYLPEDIVYVIADNSRDDDAAHSIQDVALHRKIPYVRLPRNPWHGPSRAHGLALNWTWRNIIRPHQPEAFGFLDDDMFPTAPDDPFANLQTQPFFGLIRTAERDGAPAISHDAAWFLWAGYCFFRFADVADKPLDFGQDWFSGMDTGGGNWDVLYRHFRRSDIAQAPNRFVPYRDGLEPFDGPLQWCGTWLHEIGVMGKPELKRDKRAAVRSLLEPHLRAADV